MSDYEEYNLYFDDTGSRLPGSTEKPRIDGMNCYSLGGVLFKLSDKELIQSKHEEFCAKWDIDYPLHSTKIRGQRKNFSWLGVHPDAGNFHIELKKFLMELPVIAIAAVIDRNGYNNRYKDKYGDKQWNLCKTAHAILIERSLKYVIKNKGKLRIKYEEGGTDFNNSIVKYSKLLKSEGSPFSFETSEKYDGLSKENFTEYILGEPERKKKNNRIIQIADLYLYPIAKSGYDKNFEPYKKMFEYKTIIDAYLTQEELEKEGVKYSCFK